MKYLTSYTVTILDDLDREISQETVKARSPKNALVIVLPCNADDFKSYGRYPDTGVFIYRSNTRKALVKKN
jgi:hypothetical protein